MLILFIIMTIFLVLGIVLGIIADIKKSKDLELFRDLCFIPGMMILFWFAYYILA